MILTLDLGTQTGWACYHINGIQSGSVSFKPSRWEGGGMRYLRFGRWLDEVCTLATVECVYYEEVRRHVGTDAAHVYGGLLATLTAWCERNAVPYQAIPVGTWKKSLTGKGNASKDEVKGVVQEHGYRPSDDNEADAIGIMFHVLKDKGVSL